jgi:exosortase
MEIVLLKKRFIGFLLWIGLLLCIYALPLLKLVKQSLDSGYSSHIVLVPLIVCYLVYSKWKQIFSTTSLEFGRALTLVIVAVAFVAVVYFLNPLHGSLLPTATVLSCMLLIVAGFVGAFGTTALRRAGFPVGMFIFMLPMPPALIDRIILFLQSKSADLTYWMFVNMGVPVLRDGFVMTVPGVSIQIAAECSGINSSIALLILMTIFAHETLHSNWRRALLVLLVIPFSVIKNAIRIVTLTMLAIRVDPGFLTGRLHHEGGFVFFLITLVLLYPVWRVLQRTEPKAVPSAT